MKKIFFVLISFLLILPVSAFTDQQKTLQDSYNVFYSKIDIKYGKEKKIQLLTVYQKTLGDKILDSKSSQVAKDALRFLYDLNYQKILSLQDYWKKTPFVIQKEKELSILYTKKNALHFSGKIPGFIQTLLDSWKKMYVVNDQNEFIDWNKLKKFFFTQFYTIDDSVVSFLSWKQGIILKHGSLYMLVENYTIGEKIPFSTFFSDTYKTQFITNEKKYILQNNIYYSFIFDKYSIIPEEYGFYKEDYRIDTTNLIFYQDDKWRFWYLSEFKKVKVISANLLGNVNQLDGFLKNVIDDKKDFQDDTDADFKTLRDLTRKLIIWAKTDDEKIEKIYAWILTNITYTKNLKLDDYRIYSGILTFKNRDGVCDGYSKLMGDMVMLAGITNVESIKWFVIDVPDFPQIWHAWVKIGNNYYDPTFDDPVGSDSNLTFEKYKYYKLPKDLFYTNRYDYADIPEYLKSISLDDRKALVRKNLWEMLSNYLKVNYLLLQPLKFRYFKWIPYDKDISTEDLKKIVPYYEVDSDFSFQKGTQKKFITNLHFYTIDKDSAIETILSQRNYSLSGLYLFKWKVSPWVYSYRLAYDVLFQ